MIDLIDDQTKKFLPITEAEVYTLNKLDEHGRPVSFSKEEIMVINKDHIIAIFPRFISGETFRHTIP